MVVKESGSVQFNIGLERDMLARGSLGGVFPLDGVDAKFRWQNLGQGQRTTIGTVVCCDALLSSVESMPTLR